MNRKGHTPEKHCGPVRRVVLLRKLSLFCGGFFFAIRSVCERLRWFADLAKLFENIFEVAHI